MAKIRLSLFLSIILGGIFWLILIPLWQTPDEQAHFAQVAFLSEKGRNPGGGVLDTSEEIFVSEQLLGTKRDNVGNNKFTFHPEYKIEYTDSLIGKYEASIAGLAKTDAQKKFVYEEATRYPMLYYIPATWIYKFLYSEDIFTRVFAVRIWSLVLFILNVFIIYRISKLIFSKQQLSALITTMLVGLQPMMIFSNIGVTSDSLGNLLFSLFILFSLRLIICGFSLFDMSLLLLISKFAIDTKTQFILILPLLMLLFVFLILRDIKGKQKYFVLIIFGIISITFLLSLYLTNFAPLVITSQFFKTLNLASLIKFTVEYTIPHTYKEVMPWFWGIYDWLGVTYPRIIHRIINWFVLISVIGFIFWVIKIIKKQLFRERYIQGLGFLLLIIVVYYISLSFYDWLSWYQSGYQLGIQGRYFFPVISIIMLVITIGWTNLFTGIKQTSLIEYKIISLFIVLINIFAIYVVIHTYFSANSLNALVLQASQYKPWWIKGISFLTILVSYISCLTFFLINLFIINQKDKTLKDKSV